MRKQVLDLINNPNRLTGRVNAPVDRSGRGSVFTSYQDVGEAVAARTGLRLRLWGPVVIEQDNMTWNPEG